MFSSIETYRTKIEKALTKAIEKMGEKSRLRDACSYALLNGGKRLRPILVYLVAESLGNKREVTEAALSVEFFHTASLIADDLPCMDNDDVRRNLPSLHRAFDESTALLASYTLVSAGYAALCEAKRCLQEQFPNEIHELDSIVVKSIDAISLSSGIQGATMGQYLDLFPPDASYETIRKIIVYKTANLFEVSFVLGWLFGCGDEDRLEQVKKCARHLGVAFQIADDCHDFLQDREQASKINIAHALGYDEAIKIFHEELAGFIQLLHELNIFSRPFQKICQELKNSLNTGQLQPGAMY